VSDTPQLLLVHHLRALKLPSFLREYDKLAQQLRCRRRRPPALSAALAELELIDRNTMVERRIKRRGSRRSDLDSFRVPGRSLRSQDIGAGAARCEYVARERM